MANGRTHDQVNLLLGSLSSGLLLGLEIKWQIVLTFSIGWLLSTFVFSPDTDLNPKKRTGLLGVFLYPYSVLFKHRGLSHSFFLGTLTRVVYCLIIFSGLVAVFHQMGYISLNFTSFWLDFWTFIKSYDAGQLVYQLLTWLVLGIFLADMTHLVLDKVSSLFKKIFP